MLKNLKNSRGAVELVVIALVAVIAIGGAGYYIYNQRAVQNAAQEDSSAVSSDIQSAESAGVDDSVPDDISAE